MWKIRAEHDENRYGAFVDDELVGHAACFRLRDALAVPQIQVETPFRNLGIGSDLARSICADAHEQGLRVVALCPFMRRWIQLHPQYQGRFTSRVPASLRQSTRWSGPPISTNSSACRLASTDSLINDQAA